MRRLYKFVLPVDYKKARHLMYTYYRRINRLSIREIMIDGTESNKKYITYSRHIRKLDKYLLTNYKTEFENDKEIQRYLPRNKYRVG